MKRIISLVLLMAFLVNTALGDAALAYELKGALNRNTLATASLFDDLKGPQEKDMATVRMALELQLTALIDRLADRIITPGDLIKAVAEADKYKNTIFSPPGLQFFLCETKKVANTDYLRVECNFTDGRSKEKRTYWAVFPLKKDAESGIPIKVYTDAEYQKGMKLYNNRFEELARAKRELAKPEDARAMQRYIKHEHFDQNVLRRLHEDSKVKKYTFEDLQLPSYPQVVREILSAAKIMVTNPRNLIPLENRKCTIMEMTPQVEEMLREYKVPIVAVDGTTKEVMAIAHSSNGAINIFLTASMIKGLSMDTDLKEAISDLLKSIIAHELGVMLGCPALGFDNNMPINEVDLRYLYAANNSEFSRLAQILGHDVAKKLIDSPKPLEQKTFAIADLDKNLKTRDFAMAYVPAGEVINAINIDEIAGLLAVGRPQKIKLWEYITLNLIKTHIKSVPGITDEQVEKSAETLFEQYKVILEALEHKGFQKPHIGRFNRAFTLGLLMHSVQARAKGDTRPSFLHSVGVAHILVAQYRLLDLIRDKDEALDILAGAFLHDAVEDASNGILASVEIPAGEDKEAYLRQKARETISETAGSKVVGIVEALTKMPYDTAGMEEFGIERLKIQALKSAPLGTRLIKMADWHYNFSDLENAADRLWAAKFVAKRHGPIVDFLSTPDTMRDISTEARDNFINHLIACGRRNNDINRKKGVNVPAMTDGQLAELEELLSTSSRARQRRRDSAALSLDGDEGEMGASEPPTAATVARYAEPTDLATHQFVNGVLGLVLDSQYFGHFKNEKYRDFTVQIGSYTTFDGKKGLVYRYGDSEDPHTRFENFGQIFRELVKIKARANFHGANPNTNDYMQVIRDMVERRAEELAKQRNIEADLCTKDAMDELGIPHNIFDATKDERVRFIADLESKLVMQREHFGVESGTIHMPVAHRGTELELAIIDHVNFERAAHLDLINTRDEDDQRGLWGSWPDYRNWRRGEPTVMRKINLRLTSPGGRTFRIAGLMTYADFVNEAHRIAEECYPVSVPSRSLKTPVEPPVAGIASTTRRAADKAAGNIIVSGEMTARQAGSILKNRSATTAQIAAAMRYLVEKGVVEIKASKTIPAQKIGDVNVTPKMRDKISQASEKMDSRPGGMFKEGDSTIIEVGRGAFVGIKRQLNARFHFGVDVYYTYFVKGRFKGLIFEHIIEALHGAAGREWKGTPKGGRWAAVVNWQRFEEKLAKSKDASRPAGRADEGRKASNIAATRDDTLALGRALVALLETPTFERRQSEQRLYKGVYRDMAESKQERENFRGQLKKGDVFLSSKQVEAPLFIVFLGRIDDMVANVVTIGPKGTERLYRDPAWLKNLSLVKFKDAALITELSKRVEAFRSDVVQTRRLMVYNGTWHQELTAILDRIEVVQKAFSAKPDTFSTKKLNNLGFADSLEGYEHNAVMSLAKVLKELTETIGKYPSLKPQLGKLQDEIKDALKTYLKQPTACSEAVGTASVKIHASWLVKPLLVILAEARKQIAPFMGISNGVSELQSTRDSAAGSIAYRRPGVSSPQGIEEVVTSQITRLNEMIVVGKWNQEIAIRSALLAAGYKSEFQITCLEYMLKGVYGYEDIAIRSALLAAGHEPKSQITCLNEMLEGAGWNQEIAIRSALLAAGHEPKSQIARLNEMLEGAEWNQEITIRSALLAAGYRSRFQIARFNKMIKKADDYQEIAIRSALLAAGYKPKSQITRLEYMLKGVYGYEDIAIRSALLRYYTTLNRKAPVAGAAVPKIAPKPDAGRASRPVGHIAPLPGTGHRFLTRRINDSDPSRTKHMVAPRADRASAVGKAKPGRSPEDALNVIALSKYIQDTIRKDGYFTLKDYRLGYDNLAEGLGLSQVPAHKDDSQSRRDLDTLEERGLLRIDRAVGKENRYYLTKKGLAALDKALADFELAEMLAHYFRVNNAGREMTDSYYFGLIKHIARTTKSPVVRALATAALFRLRYDSRTYRRRLESMSRAKNPFIRAIALRKLYENPSPSKVIYSETRLMKFANSTTDPTAKAWALGSSYISPSKELRQALLDIANKEKDVRAEAIALSGLMGRAMIRAEKTKYKDRLREMAEDTKDIVVRILALTAVEPDHMVLYNMLHMRGDDDVALMSSGKRNQQALKAVRGRLPARDSAVGSISFRRPGSTALNVAPQADRESQAGSVAAEGEGDRLAEIAEAKENAEKLWGEFPTNKDRAENYMLLVPQIFYANGEFRAHKEAFGDRFELKTVGGESLDKFVEQAVRTAEHSGFEDRAIALVPVTQTDMMNRDGLQASLNKLTQAGIRFIQMNNTQLADARNDVDKNARLSFQLHTYLMMIAVRNLPKGAVDPTSSAYKTLEFYLNSHFGLEKGISVEEYILAIAKDEVAQLLKGILTYRPADAYQLPAYDTIVAVLRAA